MKQLLYAIGVLMVLGAVLLWAKRPVPAPEPTAAPLPAGTVAEPREAEAKAVVSEPEPAPQPRPSAGAAGSKPHRVRSSASTPTASPIPNIARTIEALADAGIPYLQKEQTWRQLTSAGKLDEAISSLEQQVAANPNSAGAFAALGHAYLLKAGATQDYNERAALGMKIDQTFDAALKLDPANWEARFNRAVSMSYWPAFLGKDKEVVQQFLDLIQQQESQVPEPQFAQTYVKLGEQYRKLGYADYARDTWRRGAALFPTDLALSKLAVGTGQSQP